MQSSVSHQSKDGLPPERVRQESVPRSALGRADILPLALLAVGFLACTVPWILMHSADMRLLKAFNTDEHFVVEALLCMYEKTTLVVNHCVPYRLDWPRLLFYVDLGSTYPLLAALPASSHTFTIVARLVVLWFGLLSLLATYLLSLRMFNRWVAFLSGILLITTVVFLDASLTIHPDVIQLFFVLLALLFCFDLAERGRWRSLILASVFAGLAFGTKLAGAHILPIVALACFLHLYHRSHPRRLSEWFALVGKLFLRCVVATLVFLFVFIAVTPELVLTPEDMLTGFRGAASQMRVRGTGGIVADGRVDPVQWIHVMTAPSAMGIALWLFSGLGFVTVVYCLLKRTSCHLRRGHIVVFMWPVIFAGSLMGLAGYITQAHVLPAIPVVFIFAAYVLVYPWQKVSLHKDGWWWKLASAAAGVVVILLLTTKVMAAYDLLSELSEKRNSPRITAGEWLERSYPKDTVILHDQYVYIPTAFPKVIGSWGMTRTQVEAINPDLVVVAENFHKRYLIDRDFEGFEGGPDAYYERLNFYEGLAEGHEEPYAWVEGFGPIQIYANQRTLGVAPLIEELATDDLVFLPAEYGRRMEPLVDGQLGFFEHERSLVLPSRDGNRDAVYVLPAWDEELVEAFSDKWGDVMRRDEIGGDDDSAGLTTFRLDAGRLPDASSGRDMLVDPDFPLRLHGMLDTSFQTGIELVGYRLQSHSVGPNRPVRITLFWLASSDEQRDDYTVFVHLVDEAGQMLAQDDRRPLDGTYPTDEWSEGDIIIQRHVLPVSEDITEGDYYLNVGLYRLADGGRLPLMEAPNETMLVVGPLHLTPEK